MLRFNHKTFTEEDKNFSKAMETLVYTHSWKMLKERLEEEMNIVRQGRFSSFLDILLASFRETRRKTIKEIIDLVESKAHLAKRFHDL